MPGKTGALSLLLAALLVCPGLSACHREPTIELVSIRNGNVSAPAFPFLYEDLAHPLPERLRADEGLERFGDAGSEFEQLIALRQWARGQWNNRSRDEASEPYMNALLILDGIRSGRLKGGFCGEYAVVFVQACLALGHQARVISVQSRDGGGHRTSEVWSNEFDKWILMDPFYDIHFTRGGIPLNALELHEALTGGSAPPGISLVKGSLADEADTLEEILALYYDVTIIMRNNHLSLMDPMINRFSLGLRNSHTDGRPDFSMWVTDAGADLNWKVNQTGLSVSETNHQAGTVGITVVSNMSGLSGFEAKTDTLDWQRIGPSIEWSLHQGENRIAVRSRNIRGVAGPESLIVMRYK